MNKLTRYMAAVVLALTALGATAAETDSDYSKYGPRGDRSWGLKARVGYAIGGTMPIPLPAEIRSINRFRPNGGFSFGVDGYKQFDKRWGIMGGVHFFMEGMSTGADVKNYHMGISMGEDYLEGQFTGVDITDVKMSGLTIPVTATFRINPRWTVNLGPYMNVLFNGDFSGSVYDGYLRVGDPTGEKIIISRENPATYDFGDDMRTLQFGVQAGFEWKATPNIGLFGQLDWGLTDVFRSGFETVDFPMYPVYGTVGITYSLY